MLSRRLFHCIMDVMKPSVSVLMPVYRNKDSLSRAVDSLLNQDYEGKIDIVMMADDAEDGTLEEARRLKDLHPEQIQVITRDEPFFLGGARKEGIPYLKGDLIYSLDADDEMLPGAMKLLVDTLLSLNADLVNAGFYEIVGTKKKRYFYKKYQVFDNYKGLHALLHDTYFRSFLWAKLYRRELLESRPFAILQGKGVMFEDLSYCASLLLGAKKVVTIADPVINYYQDVATSSSTEKRNDRTLRHLSAFLLTRLLFEQSGDVQAIKAFYKHRSRTYWSIFYDLGRDIKAGAETHYVLKMKSYYRKLFNKKKPFQLEGTPFEEFLRDAFIA